MSSLGSTAITVRQEMQDGADEKFGEGEVGGGGRSGTPESSYSDDPILNKRPKLQPENLPEEVC